MKDEIEQLYNVIHNVPGAVCFYKWNGSKLVPLVVSEKYSELLGTDAAAALNNTEGINFIHVHPDDLPALQMAVKKGIYETHTINHTYRSYNEKLEKYIWINIQGKLVEDAEGDKYIYTTYTDISKEKETETELMESKQLMEIATELSGIWFWIYDYENDTGYMSDRIQKRFGYAHTINNFLDSLTDKMLIKEEYKKQYEAMIEKIKSGEKHTSMECMVKFAGGQYHWLQFILHSIKDTTKSGKAIATVRIIDDIKELEKKYEVEKSRGQDDESLLAFAIFNISCHRTLEMERREPLLPINTLLPLEVFREEISDSIFDTASRKKFLELFDSKVLRDCFDSGISEKSIEYQRTLPGGKVIWVRSSFHMVLEPHGKDILLFYYCNDINVDKALDIMTSFMANVDYDMLGYINFYDNSAIMLYGKNSYFGRGSELVREENYTSSLEVFLNTAVVPEERKQYSVEAFPEVVRNKLKEYDTYEFELHILNEGKILTKKMRYKRFGTNPDVCIFSQTDITAQVEKEAKRQKVLEEALENAKTASQSKTTFLSQMSHEIRTPMNAIIGMTNLALDTSMSGETREYLKKIDRSSHYLLDVINDILDMSRIESGRFELHPEWVSANSMLRTCMDMLCPQLEQKNIEFVFPDRNYDKEYEFFVDPLRMKQVLMNLLNNAIKFTPDGGKIRLEINARNIDENHREDYVTISDTGCGMSEDFLQKIFTPFEQERNPYSGEVQGTGLGLALVKQIITAMDGEISVRSELGKGTVFEYRIPYEYRSVKSAADAGDVLIEKNLEGMRLLLADDHPLNREIAKKLLEKKGIHVDEAVDGREAVRFIEQSANEYYDAVLMDIRMPVLDGIEATKCIRSLSRKDARIIPIIAMTANAFDFDVKLSMDAGMNDHLAKPIDPELLYKTLSKYVK